MLAQCVSNLLHFFKGSFSAIHFEQRLEDLESCHGSLPSLCRYGDQIRRPRLLVARGPIWFGVPYRDALKFTFAQLPGNRSSAFCARSNCALAFSMSGFCENRFSRIGVCWSATFSWSSPATANAAAKV